MLKTLWVIDALLLLSALAIVLLSRGLDAPGRAILWVVPIAVGGALAASFAANRSGASLVALSLALVGPAVAAGIFLTLGKSLLRERLEKSGASYWTEPAMHQLVRAIVAADTTGMKAAMTAGADFNKIGKFGMTVLGFTVTHQANMVGEVIRLGANPNLEVPGQITALAQSLHAQDPAMQQLLEGGANPDGAGENQSPIIFSAIGSQNWRNYELLVTHGANVNVLDETGRSTLISAAELSQWKIAMDLLARGVDVAVQSRDGVTIASVVARTQSTNATNEDYRAFVTALNTRERK